MKKVLILILATAVIAVGLLAACSVSRPVSIAGSVIRLHILANSDTQDDQQIKLKVRDRVLEEWGEELSASEDGAAAWETLQTLIPEISESIGDYLAELGADYGAEVTTGTFDFPERDYDGVVFPKGEYKALRISLGNATGHNWWCVMFPPLCLISADGEMDIEQYKELVMALDDKDVAPDAPVRSWLFDKLVGKAKWDSDFLSWAKEYWLGGKDK